MSVPDHRHVPKKLHDTGLFDLTSHEGHAAFTDAVVSTLHGIDPKWRHLKKRPGQTNIHRHGEDSVLYLLPDNKAQAVDFIVGAGGPNPRPGWIVGDFVYSHADGHDPGDHGIGTVATAPPPPPQHAHPSRAEMIQAGAWLDGYYRSAEGLRRPAGLSQNGVPDWEGVGAWLFDVYFNARVDGKTPDQARAVVVAAIRHTDEWQGKHPGERP
jgi:hypothetical protein